MKALEMPVVPVYAALLGLVFVVLSVRTLRLRRKLQIAVGDAGNEEMLRAIRVHGNFAEYVPLTLFVLYLMEVSGAGRPWLHLLCACLLVGRLAHAFGVGRLSEKFQYRVFGMAMTLTTLVVGCLYLLVVHLPLRG